MRRWALVGALAAGGALAAIVLVVVVTGEEDCAALTVERAADAPAAVALDEARVRNDAPQLAALLDRAADEGRATETHSQTARAMHAYLEQATGGADAFTWRGTTFAARLSPC